jgi:hypothetical protein
VGVNSCTIFDLENNTDFGPQWIVPTFFVHITDYAGPHDPVQGIGVYKPRRFTNLAAAKQCADSEIEKPLRPESRRVIEVVQQTRRSDEDRVGAVRPAKYRLEREASGEITVIPLV